MIERGRDQASAARSERMANSDRSAVRIHVRRIVRDAQIAEYRKGLRGESFIELDDVHLCQSEIRLCQHFARCR